MQQTTQMVGVESKHVDHHGHAGVTLEHHLSKIGTAKKYHETM